MENRIVALNPERELDNPPRFLLYQRARIGSIVGTTGLVPVDRRLAARTVSLRKLSPPRGLSPWSDDCWSSCQSSLHGDKPRGGRPMLWIGFWPSVIDPPGQARWSLTAKPRTVILVISHWSFVLRE